VKWIVRILVVFVVLVAGFLVSSFWWLDGAAKSAIESAGSEAMGTTVKLKSIDIGVLGGTASLEGFNIANPGGGGYEKPFFFDLQSGTTEVTLKSVMEDTIEIPKIELTGITMYLEPGKGGKYNYKQILENIEEYTKSDKPKDDAKEKKIVVKRLELRDIKVYYKTKVFVQAPVHVDEIVMNDVGSEGAGVDVGELISIILAGTLKGTADLLPGAIGNGVKAGLGALGDVGGVAVDAVTKGVEAVGDTAKKGVESVGKGVKKLLGGD